MVHGVKLYVPMPARNIYNPEARQRKITHLLIQIGSTCHLKDLQSTLKGSELILFIHTY